MKDLRLLKNLFFFLLLGFSLCAIQACGGDDEKDETMEEPTIKDDEEEIVPSTPEVSKRLVEIKEIDGEGDIEFWEFSYDEEGDLKYIVEKDKEVYSITFYSQYDSIIMVKSSSWMGYDELQAIKINGFENESQYTKYQYRLKDGLVYAIKEYYSLEEDFAKFEYNSSKSISKIETEYDGVMECVWNNGVVKSISSGEGIEMLEFTYSNRTCKGYFPLWGFYMSYYLYNHNYSMFMACPQLFGMSDGNLPDKIQGSDWKGSIEKILSYKFDDEGYVESCEVVDLLTVYEDDEVVTYQFKWEEIK